MKNLNPVSFDAENGAQDVDSVKDSIIRAMEEVYPVVPEQITPGFAAARESLNSLAFVWDASKNLDFTRFYQKNGSKITRGLKGVLLKMFLKPYVEKGFAEFCKRIGDLYIEIVVSASIQKPYFTIHSSAKYGSDDSGSCFRTGGENESNGKLIDGSPSTGVLCIGTPETSRYAPGRMILFIKTETEAHLLNQYTTDGRSGLPYSLFVRALERLSGAKISFRKVDSEGPERGFLPVYTNNGNIVCTATEGNFLSMTDSPGVFACPECGGKFTHKTGYFNESGSAHYVGCSEACTEDQGSVRCSDCGGRVHDDDSYSDDNGNPYCEGCYNDRFAYCDSCETSVDNDDMRDVHDERGRDAMVCRDCRDAHYTECNKCGEFFHNDVTLITAVDTEMRFCDGCGESLPCCDNCGDVFEDKGELDSDGNCATCHVEPEEEEDAPLQPQEVCSCGRAKPCPDSLLMDSCGKVAP